MTMPYNDTLPPSTPPSTAPSAAPSAASSTGPTRLADLGPRLCIFGPSGSGKSSLALAISRKTGLPVAHLDQLHHQPGTDWVQRPPQEFAALHRAAIAGERWVIEGNYSALMPERIARATGVILLDIGTPRSLWRYVRRSLFERRTRVGGLEGARDSVKWDMLHHIAVVTPPSRRRYAAKVAALDKPKIILPSARAIADFYASEGLM